jgi:lipopolysaccharide/colanic/teichoic acid biosynthesis glycosyltransferase
MIVANSTQLKQFRKQRISALLHSPKSMELVLRKERVRCDRHGQLFSLIVIQNVNGRSIKAGALPRPEIKILAKILHKRLRLTDEKGVLLKGGLGILLPMTDLIGAKVVQSSIIQLCDRQGLELDSEVFFYSGLEHFTDGSSIDSDEYEVDDAEDDSTSKGSPNPDRLICPSSAPSHASVDSLTRFVRADNVSQNRLMGVGRIVPTSTVPSPHICPRYPAWKRVMDMIGGSIGLIISIPFIVLAAIAIKLTSKGPIFFRQMRTGQYGNAFPMYKLRTMVVDAEQLKEKLQALNERDGPAFKLKNDPRVTKVGAILRKTGLDELPQLWNVVVGDMAIVGPRPLPCSEDAKCKLWHRRRLDTKPGLTCIWQISKTRKIAFSEWMRMDLQYADKRTFLGDINLMCKTAMAVFLGRVGH